MKTQAYELPDERREDIVRLAAELRPKPQANVREADVYVNAATYAVRLNDVKLLVMVEVECIDGELWAHMSVSAKRPPRLPTWVELGWCKSHFLGDRRAIQVLPPRSEYVNENPHVLNVYAPLERNPLPDFRGRIAATGRLSI